MAEHCAWYTMMPACSSGQKELAIQFYTIAAEADPLF